MSPRFVLKIKLGNDAMQTGEDVARALREVAEWIDDDTPFDQPEDGKTIFDVFGNTVGNWHVTDDVD